MEEGLSRDEFTDRVERIGDRGGELWGRLAQRAEDLEPDAPLPADVKQALTDLVEFQEQAAAELDGLHPPEAGEEAAEMLIEALRERTETFEQAIEVGHFTPQNSDRVTRAGEKINRAFEQLRDEGFRPIADEHEGE